MVERRFGSGEKVWCSSEGVAVWQCGRWWEGVEVASGQWVVVGEGVVVVVVVVDKRILVSGSAQV